MRRRSAQNSRGLGERRRQPLFGERDTGEDDIERARRSRAAENCKPPFRPPRGKLPARPESLSYRELSSHVFRGERSRVGAPLAIYRHEAGLSRVVREINSFRGNREPTVVCTFRSVSSLVSYTCRVLKILLYRALEIVSCRIAY